MVCVGWASIVWTYTIISKWLDIESVASIICCISYESAWLISLYSLHLARIYGAQRNKRNIRNRVSWHLIRGIMCVQAFETASLASMKLFIITRALTKSISRNNGSSVDRPVCSTTPCTSSCSCNRWLTVNCLAKRTITALFNISVVF